MIEYIKNLFEKKNPWGYGNNNQIIFIFLKILRKWLIILLLFVLLGIDISFAEEEIPYSEEEWEALKKFEGDHPVIWGLGLALTPVCFILLACMFKGEWTW